MRKDKTTYTYSLHGTLPGGCVHMTPITRGQARRILNRRDSGELRRLHPGTSARACDTGLTTSTLLPGGYRYLDVRLWLVASSGQALRRRSSRSRRV